jgi:hypothetical protein
VSPLGLRPAFRRGAGRCGRRPVCLVGRNGSGKSTLLRIAAGLVQPDAGDRFAQPGTTIHYLPQEPNLLGFDITLAYVEAGFSAADERRHRALYLLKELGLSGEENPAALSGGEARRAALARALAPSPDILLLDEPTNHLDLPVSSGWSASWPGCARVSSWSATTAGCSSASRTPRSGSTAASPGSSTKVSRHSNPGAMRCWSRRRPSGTSSAAR